MGLAGRFRSRWILALTLTGTALSGCTAAGAHDNMSSSSPAITRSPAPPSPTPTAATPSTTPNESSKRAEYEADIAAWTEPLPPGYSWPAWNDLPHTEPFGVGYFAQADNAAGVYRCILIDAAWHAYFETNDAPASKDYATRADAYAIPDNPETNLVTECGRIIDEELARANNFCRGIAGDLQHE